MSNHKMAIWQGKSKRKPTGGKYWPSRKKRLSEMGSNPTNTKVSEKATKNLVRTRGANYFTRLITANVANLNLGGGKFKLSKIKTVKQNSANRHFVRMNVITKGAIIETENGLARVTSRPGKDGIINAVLVKA